MDVAEKHWDEVRKILSTLKKEETRSKYLEFHERMKGRFISEPASCSIERHHWWPGGYACHIHEVLYNTLKIMLGFPLPRMSLSIDEAIICAYIHDLDKMLYRYQIDDDPPSEKQIQYGYSLGIVKLPEDTKTTFSQKIDAAKNRKTLDPSRMCYHTYRKEALQMEDSGAVAFFCGQYGLPVNMRVIHVVGLHHGGWAPLAVVGNPKKDPLVPIIHSADLISGFTQNGEVDIPDFIVEERNTTHATN